MIKQKLRNYREEIVIYKIYKNETFVKSNNRMLKQGYEKNTNNAIIHYLKNFSFQHMHLLPVKCVYRALAVFSNLQKNNAPTKRNSGKHTFNFMTLVEHSNL